MAPKRTQRKIFALSLPFLLLVCLMLLGCDTQPPAPVSACRPTPEDEIGPFYRPNAPVRQAVGRGYELTGTVLSAGDCRPLPKARIEFWLVNPQGDYDETHRATVFAGRQGRYRFESNRPTDYVGRKPHIHIMVSAAGHERLVTQHYPRENSKQGVFDLVLVPMPVN